MYSNLEGLGLAVFSRCCLRREAEHLPDFTPIYEPSYRRQGGHGAAWAGHGHGVGQRLGLGPGQAAGPGPRHGSRPRGRRGAGMGGSAGPDRGERAGGVVGPAVLLLALPGPV